VSQITIMPTMTHQLGAITGVGIDLHLGQKPKLGGGTLMIHSSMHHILSILCISTFCFLSFSLSFLFLFLLSKTQKRPKIFPLFLFVCLFSFVVLVCFVFYFRVDIRKIQKDFALFAVSFCSCFKI
jgi:hypothetical protein